MKSFKEHILEQHIPSKSVAGDIYLNPDRREMAKFLKDSAYDGRSYHDFAGIIMDNGDLLVFKSMLHATFINSMRRNQHYKVNKSQVAEHLRFEINPNGTIDSIGPSGGFATKDQSKFMKTFKMVQNNKWIKKLARLSHDSVWSGYEKEIEYSYK